VGSALVIQDVSGHHLLRRPPGTSGKLLGNEQVTRKIRAVGRRPNGGMVCGGKTRRVKKRDEP